MPKTGTRPHPESSATVTIAQLADRWQVSPDTVRREISRGHLRAVRIGRSIRIRERDIARAERPVTPAEFAYSGGAA